jgi:hypothetical protein
MAATFVQAKTLNYSGAGGTPTLAFDSPVTQGNLIISCMFASESTSMTFAAPTDNLGAGSTWAIDQSQNMGLATLRQAIASATAAATGSCTVTQHWTKGGGATIKGVIHIAEFAVPAASPYDANGSGSQFTASANSATCTSTGSSAEADEIQIAFGCSRSSNLNVAHTTPVAAGGWTDFGLNNDSQNFLNGHSVYRLTNTAGSQSITMACTGGGSGGFGILLASYKAASAAVISPGSYTPAQTGVLGPEGGFGRMMRGVARRARNFIPRPEIGGVYGIN